MLWNLQKNQWLRLALGAAIAFFVVTMVFTLHRYYTFYASFDQGIFNQVFWNGTHGRFFQSSLSSSLSTNVVHNDEVPDVSYHRLGQHFTPALLLWLPIYSLFPSPVTLSVLHVTMVTAAGLVLYVLARQYLEPQLSAFITVSYYAANAIAGPTLSNFHDNFQIPLFAFGLLLAMEKRWWWLFWILAVFILAVRADGGISLFGVGVYMTLSKRYPRRGLAVCILSFGYIVLLTNLIMPLFSDDISRRFMLERFGQYVNAEEASTLDILWAFITQPGLVLVEIVTPVWGKLKYLLGQGLPFAFVPAFSPAAWSIAGFPLLAIFLQQGQTALSINIRYAMTVVPGLCYGAILWWSHRQSLLDASVRQAIAEGVFSEEPHPPAPQRCEGRGVSDRQPNLPAPLSDRGRGVNDSPSGFLSESSEGLYPPPLQGEEGRGERSQPSSGPIEIITTENQKKKKNEFLKLYSQLRHTFSVFFIDPIRKKIKDWWIQHPNFLKISMRRFWAICIGLSLLFTFTSNPNRTFYFAIPDSIDPWVYVSLPRQWEHSSHIRSLMRQIPPDASVSATTYLVPPLSGRREVLRFPFLQLRNDAREVISVEYAIADLWQLQQYLPAFKYDRQLFRDLIPFIEQLYANRQYGIIGFEDGAILMRRDAPSDPDAVAAWLAYRQQIEPLLD